MLRVFRIRASVSRFRARDVVHSYGGVALLIHLSDPLAAGWYDRDCPELTEIALLKEGKLRPAARVFNLGAHQAVVALQLASVVGATGEVVDGDQVAISEQGNVLTFNGKAPQTAEIAQFETLAPKRKLH